MKRLDEILGRATPPALRSSTGSSGFPAARGHNASGDGNQPEILVCEACGGAGFVRRDLPVGHPDFGRAMPCECVLSESSDDRLARLQRYSSLGPLTRLTFANLVERGRSANPRDQAQFRRLTADAKAFADNPEGWLLIHGPSGAGKTHAGAAIANRCIERGQAVLFVVVPDLLDHLRATFNPGTEITYDSLFEQVRNASILILDDLGTQSATPWAQEKLFQILNHRYNAQLPTVVTTNINIERLDERLRMRLTDPGISRVYHVEAAARAVDANLPDALDLERIREMTFESFDVAVPHLSAEQKWSLEAAYRSALAFSEAPEDWLLLLGQNGCGKTHLAAAIANRLRARGERPVFFVVADLLDYLSANSGATFLDSFNQVKNAPVLILDDLGAQSDVGWVRDRLFQLLNHRYAARLATVITVATSDLDPRLKRLEERVLTRLNDPVVCTEVPIIAPPYRVDLHQPEQTGRRPPTRGGTRRPK